MPRKKIKSKKRQRVAIPAGMLEWLSGKPLRECDAETQAESFFWWCDYEDGVTGVVAYAQEHDLMGNTLPPEVASRVADDRRRAR